MTASSRFGYSMTFGAVISGVVVAVVSAKRHAQLAAAVARTHPASVQTATGEARVAAFAVLAVIIGLVTFAAATALRAKPRPARGQAAPRASRYGGVR